MLVVIEREPTEVPISSGEGGCHIGKVRKYSYDCSEIAFCEIEYEFSTQSDGFNQTFKNRCCE